MVKEKESEWGYDEEGNFDKTLYMKDREDYLLSNKKEENGKGN